MKTVNALETSNLKELSEKNFVQVEPLIEHFLPGMGVFLFCGSSKIGKSWMALQIGLCVATGTKFWNYDVRKKDVLYLCLEDGERRLQDRVFSTAEEYPDNFIYTTNADAILVRNGRRDAIMASSLVPNLYSLYSTVFRMEIIIIR